MLTQLPVLFTSVCASHCDLACALLTSRLLIAVASLRAVVPEFGGGLVLLLTGVVGLVLGLPGLVTVIVVDGFAGPLFFLSATKYTTAITATATTTVAATAPTRAPRPFFGA